MCTKLKVFSKFQHHQYSLQCTVKEVHAYIEKFTIFWQPIMLFISYIGTVKLF